jgi:hypothetical protein
VHTPTDASPVPSRALAHGSGPMRLATGDDRFQDAPSTCSQGVCDQRGYFDVGFLEHGLDVLGMLYDLARELLPRPRQIAQFLNRLWWHEARPD